MELDPLVITLIPHPGHYPHPSPFGSPELTLRVREYTISTGQTEVTTADAAKSADAPDQCGVEPNEQLCVMPVVALARNGPLDGVMANQATNQATNQSINQPTNQLIIQSINQPTNQASKQPINQATN